MGWLLPGLVFIGIWIISWFGVARSTAHPFLKILLITLLSGAAAVLAYRQFRLQHSQTVTRAEIQRLTLRVEQLQAEISGVYKLSTLYSKARSEADIINALLNLCIDLVGAQGASFVPLDDRGQPLTAQTRGELPNPALEAWAEYLASPAIRQRCQQCQMLGELNTNCPLLKSPFTDVSGLFCLPLSSGNREWGIMNLYLPDQIQLEPETKAFINTLLQDTALALESRRLRMREVEAIQQMRLIQQRSDLSGLLTSLLENIRSAFGANLAQIEIQVNRTRRRVAIGELEKNINGVLSQTIESVLQSSEPVQVETSSQEALPSQLQYRILAVPLFSRRKQVIGALGIAALPNQQNQTHQIGLLHSFAAQVELVVENAELLAHIEYQTIIQERTRLAREIHDGLAQTLGLLKLQTAQSLTYLNRAEIEKLRSTLNMVHQALSEAYEDIRSAIDGLRIDTDPLSSLAWLAPMLQEFEALAGIDTHLEISGHPEEVPAEIQTQLIRIIQEALNNIRKHSRAQNVWLRSSLSAGDWWLEIRDDGAGFTPEDVPTASRYGLLGMRERADLIGADFQIVSQQQQGTQIRLRFPAVALLDWQALDRKGTIS